MSKKIRSSTKRIISLTLTLIFILSTISSNVYVTNNYNYNYEIDMNETFIEEKSENRMKYEQLQDGNHMGGELREKFNELFGDHYTYDYIREKMAIKFR